MTRRLAACVAVAAYAMMWVCAVWEAPTNRVLFRDASFTTTLEWRKCAGRRRSIPAADDARARTLPS